MLGSTTIKNFFCSLGLQQKKEEEPEREIFEIRKKTRDLKHDNNGCKKILEKIILIFHFVKKNVTVSYAANEERKMFS